MAEEIKILDLSKLDIIKIALEKTLYVPDVRLKPKIIEELLIYLNSRLSEEHYRIKIFIALKQNQICGFVVCQIEPEYKSRNRKCGTFGWLNVDNFKTCKYLMSVCEEFFRQQNIHLIRGNINFPKGLGGIGIQTKGFKEQMLYGVAFSNLKSNILDYLEKLGYKKDTKYICMRVTKKTWKKGNKLDKSIKLRHITLEEIKKRKEEILNLAKSAFSAVLPDSTAGENRFNEIIDTYSKVPDSFYKLGDNFNPRLYSEIPDFLEDWELNNLENKLTWAHFAFDKKSDEIVGVIFTLPDLYQLWLKEPITRVNVDTVMIKPKFTGRGIFSSLNNWGQLTSGFNGITYFEGTSIWVANKDAIRTVMPHCETNRKFIVVQKRIKKSNSQ